MAKKKRLTWRQFHILVRGLAERVESAGFRPDVLVGVTRGGLVPLAILGELMGMKNVATISARSYDGVERGKLNITALPEIDLRGKRVLLVDEITDSGETLKKIAVLVAKHYQTADVKTAVVVTNTAHCTHAPDFSMMETDVWVVFPWQEWPRRKREEE